MHVLHVLMRGVPPALRADFVPQLAPLLRREVLGFGVLRVTVPDAHVVLFVAYCLLQFSLNWGPKLSTFVMPSEVHHT